ncbi:flagellar export chaperone FliS [Brevibacillus agri]|uniref:flagellar export chaperone FliS n=1 Tax=Brevibacillus agri TaxID=51101 RepID=UPI002E1EBC00|nr:flagellar export chaperone FliS [Brevibacillus agri]MED1642034.1 flagellar export chaperone FliS [Brevibacillus agri]MED1655866.1 flagellar export chaperone FliS [Brevibacillus agri]MED1685025.1 flagellar export chaperone FliS [Brevibacillus agri]MED1693602.1 flagellar export chaperone FliS [Brevibacillus agri]MED1697584.1 flagellar export chaperone FliS [Brevibacillus agri]
MGSYNPAQAYKNNSVTTASPGELTLMLYNGALKFLKQAKNALVEKQWEKSHEYNVRVQDIFQELIVTLDRSYPIAEQMFQLYDYLYRRMIEANIKKEIAILDEVEEFVIQFRDTWKQAMVLAKTQG